MWEKVWKSHLLKSPVENDAVFQQVTDGENLSLTGTNTRFPHSHPSYYNNHLKKYKREGKPLRRENSIYESFETLKVIFLNVLNVKEMNNLL